MNITTSTPLSTPPVVGSFVSIGTRYGGVVNRGEVVSVTATFSPAGRPMWRIRTTQDTSYVSR